MLVDGDDVRRVTEPVGKGKRVWRKYSAATALSALVLVLGSVVGGWSFAGAAASGLPSSVSTAPSAHAVAGQLSSVSCPAPDACTAVGSYGTVTDTLAEVWNGNAWTIQSTPNPVGGSNNVLAGVACASSEDCVAVGSYFGGHGNLPLAETWDGTSWTIQNVPLPTGGLGGSLDAVSCNAASECTVVGSYADNGNQNESLAERWNGTAFTLQTVPTPAGATTNTFGSVSCVPSSSDCTAVGWFFESGGSEIALSFAEGWNGTRWSVESTPAPIGASGGAYPTGVSCRTPHVCVAVGEADTASGGLGFDWAQASNGASWSNQTTASPSTATASVLSAVSCSGGNSNMCMAAGAYENGSTLAPFAEMLRGSTWKVKTTPDPSGSTNADLQGVSCGTPPGTCAAVGYVTNSSGVVVTVADGWNGTKWSVEKTPIP